MESYKFNSIAQKEKQMFNEFETELRTQLSRCEYTCGSCGKSYEERMLRNRILIGILDKKLQLRLLDDRNISLEKATDMCKAFEEATVKCGENWDTKHAERYKAKGQVCRSCSKVGHFERMCRQTKMNNNNSSRGSGSKPNADSGKIVNRKVNSLDWDNSY
ncbi:PREDICTED: uncharacterized protein LOC108364127 isoform X2 [Rhagoletis zephyria]|uniref:uncharacterized protein LOC108364127 isoform X2 n=1 Tax=Rhagoletis zephyria TaxID=28612 RepID=UPI00081197F9|nr:PREDICTED: uncharacterized protein LOC108364127 isoform X2 [Rhagoletis zephyria]